MDEPRRVVGEYSLGKVLGKGSFAIVWKGSHLKSGREVAVKEINVKQLSAKLRQSLECEVSILQKVEHQNIVRLLDTFEVINPTVLQLVWKAA
jgi:serine/threonine-protein kinase ULK/ATG1